MLMILILISGLLMVLPLSYPELFFLEWIALIPVLIALRGATKRKSFWLGWLLGIFVTAGASFWLYYPLVDYSGLPLLVIVLLLVLLFSLLGVIYGIWAWVFKILNNREFQPLVLAISWTGMEFIRYKILSFYPLGFTAYTQVGFKSLLQLADLGGIFLISFIVILINGLLYKSWLRKNIRLLLPLVLIFILIFSYGGYKLNYYQKLNLEEMTIGLIPTDLNPIEKWASENIENNLNYFLQSARSLEKEEQQVKLMVMPESALTFDIIRNEYFRNKFFKQMNQLNSYMLASGRAVVYPERPKEAYNSSFLISPEGRLLTLYNKVRLLPFGEYMPLSEMIYKLTGLDLGAIVSAVGSTTPGEEEVIFQLNDIYWQTVICSEIFYPLNPGNKAELIVTQSNEAWFRKGNLQQQMWTAASFRAVENRSSIVKAGNHAYSGMILPSGLTEVRTERTVVRPFIVKAPILNSETVYQRWGDFSGYLSLLLMLILLLFKLLKSFTK